MFTGLVQDVGKVLRTVARGSEAELEVETRLSGIVVGESIAVDGACLSATSWSRSRRVLSAFASSETVARTGLDRVAAGFRVNLERAVTAERLLGGHLVTGHVDARVELLSRERDGSAERWRVSLPDDPELARQLASKGSVALSGVSLTVNAVDERGFEVMIIPLTLETTNLGSLRPKERLNLETDVLAKYVARQLAGKKDAGDGGVGLDLLERAGFVR
ncbi:MAG: riboflavin synthase [Polyangia bacterium]